MYTSVIRSLIVNIGKDLHNGLTNKGYVTIKNVYG